MRFQCPYCRNVVAVENSDLGLDVQCGHCSEVVTVPSSRISTGCLIADFIVQEELGRGGMGVVYLSHQISLDRLSALKVLADQYANDAEFVVGFIKEARAAAKLNHPHIVQAYAVGEDEGVFYFAMENVEGETMKEVQRREKIISVDKAVMVIQQIAEALDYAWKEAKLVHRDIKPDNIMMTKKGSAKLADLGLARVAGDIDDSESDEVMGTPQYISPEHLTGAPMDVRSDIYSLGATFYHMITGRFAFEGKSAAEIAKKHLQEPLQPAIEVNPEIPQDVSDIIMKMMEKNPKRRYQEAETLVDDLRIARRGKGQTSASESAKKNTKNSKNTKNKMTNTSSSRKFKKSGTSTSISKPGSVTRTKIKTTHTKNVDTISATGTHSAILREKQEQDAAKSKKMMMILGGCALVAIIGAGIFLSLGSETEENVVVTTEETATPEATVPNENAALLKEISELMALKKTDESVFINECREFFTNIASPMDPEAAIAYNKLNAFFVLADEDDQLVKKREAIRKAHIKEIELVEVAEEEKAKQQANAENLAEQKEKLISKFAELKEALDEKESEGIEDLKKRTTSKKWQNLDKVLSMAKGHNYDQALEEVGEQIEELEEKYNRLKKVQKAGKERHLKSLAFWIKTAKSEQTKQELTQIKNTHSADDASSKAIDAALESATGIYETAESIISEAQSLWNALYNSGKSLKDITLEINNSIASVISISKDRIILELSSGKKIARTFDQLPAKQLYRLIMKTSDLADLSDDAVFSYYLCSTSHSAMSLEADEEFKKLGYKLLIVHYTNLAKIATISERGTLTKKAQYLENKFKSEFSEEAENFNFDTAQGSSGLDDL